MAAPAATTSLPSDVSLVGSGSVDASRLRSSARVTDAYLLALAVRHGGRLVGCDRGISPSCVPGATEAHLRVP